MRKCETKMCHGYQREPAVAEYFGQLTGQWFAVCRKCKPILENLEHQARPFRPPSENHGFRELQP